MGRLGGMPPARPKSAVPLSSLCALRGSDPIQSAEPAQLLPSHPRGCRIERRRPHGPAPPLPGARRRAGACCCAAQTAGHHPPPPASSRVQLAAGPAAAAAGPCAAVSGQTQQALQAVCQTRRAGGGAAGRRRWTRPRRPARQTCMVEKGQRWCEDARACRMGEAADIVRRSRCFGAGDWQGRRCQPRQLQRRH